MKDAFEKFGYKQGYSVGMGAASLGLLIGVSFGSACVNWGLRNGLLEGLAAVTQSTDEPGEIYVAVGI